MATITKKELLAALGEAIDALENSGKVDSANLIKSTYIKVSNYLRFANDSDEIEGASFVGLTSGLTSKFLIALDNTKKISGGQTALVEKLIAIETDVTTWTAKKAPEVVEQAFTLPITKRQRICLFVLIGILIASAIAAVIVMVLFIWVRPDEDKLASAASIIGVTDMTFTIVALIYERASDMKKRGVAPAVEALRSEEKSDKKKLVKQYSSKATRNMIKISGNKLKFSNTIFDLRGGGNNEQKNDDNK